MGPYLSVSAFWVSPGLILLSRELLEAREGACLRGCGAQAGWGSGLSAQPLSLGTIWDTVCPHLPGASGPSMGGMFDRGVHVFSKQTLIHVSRRNLQTDFCWSIHQERDGLCKQRLQAVSISSMQTPSLWVPGSPQPCPGLTGATHCARLLT
jgi:hypothetical protein